LQDYFVLYKWQAVARKYKTFYSRITAPQTMIHQVLPSAVTVMAITFRLEVGLNNLTV
jgi:hypothetical protein